MGYISACSIPNTIRRGKNYYLHFRLPNKKFFRASLGCDSVERTRYILTRLSLFISLVKSDRMEPIQLRDILKDMKKLEQKDNDDYLLHSQALHYAAAKNIRLLMLVKSLLMYRCLIFGKHPNVTQGWGQRCSTQQSMCSRYDQQCCYARY